MERKTSDKKKRNRGFLGAVILIFFIVMAVIFAIKWPELKKNFQTIFGTKETVETVEDDKDKISLGKADIVKDEEGDITISLKNSEVAADLPEAKEERKVESAPVATEQAKPAVSEKTTAKAETSVEEKTQTAEKTSAAAAQENKTEKKQETQTVQKTETSTIKNTAPAASVAKTELQLCFIYITSEGKVDPRIVKRTVNKSDSPLTDAINLLIKGPDTTLSAEKNLNSYINTASRLLGAKVKDGVAYLNFNEDFCFNNDGNAGIINQLEQIVYTATTFSTVKSVQFMIEGNTEEYIGDGIWIGSPLTRMSF